MEDVIILAIGAFIFVGVIVLGVFVLRWILGTSTMIAQNAEIIRLLKKIGGEK
jgi:hypothetical protein